MLKKLVSFVFSSLLLLGCGFERYDEPPPTKTADGLSAPVRVSHVVDGDTIIVNMNGRSEKVRLIGVDTPESVHRDESKNTREGKIVSERLSSFLKGKLVQLEFDKEMRDKYNRLLAYVYVDGNMVNRMLLTAGLARTLSIPPNTKYAEEFEDLETNAAMQSKGFWGHESNYFLEGKP